MSEIRRGLRIDDDEVEAPKYEKVSLDANRKKTNFQKDVDDLLFGGMKPVVRRQPKQQPKVATNTEAAKSVQKPVVPVPKVTASNASVNKSAQVPIIKPTQSKIVATLPPKPKMEQKPKPKVGQKKLAGTNLISSVKTLGIQSKIVPPKVNNYVEADKTQIIMEQTIIEQPKHYEEPKVGKQQKIDVAKVLYNRPVYIRKLKKIAEDYAFATQNITNHISADVVRPFQTDKARMKKFNDVDFIDSEFPPISYSLGLNLKNSFSQWKRHSQIARSSVFGKYIDPNDINPGKLSCPQFLSTLSALAQMQANIKRLTQDQKVNLNGFQLIRLNINGVWRYFPVDNKLPFADGEALGAQSFNDNQSQLWAALVQKAYAKAYNGYDVFTRSVPREYYLRDLTGSPVRKYLVTDNNLSNVIRTAISSGQVVMAVPKNQILSLGLNPNHSFSVINCKSNGGLQLRNSWGTLEERSKLTISKQGVFELSSNQTKQFISYVMIAHTNNSWSSSTIQSKHKTGFYSTFSFRINNQSQGFISISQLDERLFPVNAYEYSTLRFILQKKSSDGSSIYINAGCSSSKNLDVEVNLTSGEYQIFVSGHWKSRQLDYYLTFFGQEKIQFKRVYTAKFPNKIAQALTRLNLETGKRSSLGHISQFIQHHKESNLVLITAENVSEKDYLFNQDFSKINFNTLLLLNAKNNEQTYQNLTESEIAQHKNHAIENRKWSVSIEPKGHFTWVVSCSQEYDVQNFKKWGFR